jgi:hypothetical protein
VIANAGLKNWLEQESTMLVLKLNKVERTEQRAGGYVDGDDEGVTTTAPRPIEHTRLAFVVADKIRNIQPRRNDAPGSRLTFVDGGGYAVQESPDEILAFMSADVRGRSADVVQISEAAALPQPVTERRSRRRSEAQAEAEVQNIEGTQH